MCLPMSNKTTPYKLLLKSIINDITHKSNIATSNITLKTVIGSMADLPKGKQTSTLRSNASGPYPPYRV